MSGSYLSPFYLCSIFFHSERIVTIVDFPSVGRRSNAHITSLLACVYCVDVSRFFFSSRLYTANYEILDTRDGGAAE